MVFVPLPAIDDAPIVSRLLQPACLRASSVRMIDLRSTSGFPAPSAASQPPRRCPDGRTRRARMRWSKGSLTRERTGRLQGTHHRHRQIVTVASLAAQGNAAPQSRTKTDGASPGSKLTFQTDHSPLRGGRSAAFAAAIRIEK